ncbi:MAG: hypothetical protein HUU43_11440 [Ignavibacteriaceae bacterium]|nr:hypothetical protein [Ignavibacteriaceae bacterium]NUM71456.1 hypothetical protein [Ignavibacteriaceae bacterium]
MLNNRFFSVLDIGSNSFHLIIAEKKENGFEIADREKAVLRLSTSDVNGTSYIKETDIRKGINLIFKAKELAARYNAPIRIVATSAVREAVNKEDFLRRVAEETGDTIQVISGIEEAQYIYEGITAYFNWKNEKVLSIDIGGGSTELSVGRTSDAGIEFVKSLKVGSVRLSQRFFPDYKIETKSLIACTHYVLGYFEVFKEEIQKTNFTKVAVTAGTAKSIFTMAEALLGKPVKRGDFRIVRDADVRVVYDMVMSNRTFRRRLKIPGLEAKRADIIPAGMIIFRTIMESLGIEEMYYSEYALREGLLFHELQNLNGRKQ